MRPHGEDNTRKGEIRGIAPHRKDTLAPRRVRRAEVPPNAACDG